MNETFDVVCLGAGPAGEALTNELKGSGLTLAVAEKRLVGGECAYWGCMPSKTLLRAAETLTEADRARTLAASEVTYSVDYPKIADRTLEVARRLDDSRPKKALEDAGARVFRGLARLTGPRTVEIDGTVLTARKAVVIAAGTEPAMPPIEGIEHVDYWTNREAVLAPELPESLVVVGGGAIGVELAQAFRRLGTRVRILESGAHVLAVEDPVAGTYLQGRLEAEGIDIDTGVRVVRAESDAAGIRISLKDGESFTAARVLLATGRRPNTDSIDVDAAGVKLKKGGFVEVDPQTLLAADGIYAVGDINGLGGFTHLSHYHGTWVARMLKGEPVKTDHAAIPRVIFTDPEVGVVGLSEAQAREQGLDVRTATASLADSARGYIHGDPGGVIKLVADGKRDVLVGAVVVGPRAGEMISELGLAIKAAIPLDVMRDFVHPFPTFSRILQGLFVELG
jgi:pyruvate/2-oxoglutarate dehydrogenase complex dihydrolipoamide dehydrogenase (E3) component